ncbi:7-carboxy-7-deazaguanine synthase QueE [Heliobacterium chlorum]|uniref:7-carboxy-7-deazaguanine synthase n=1 Tax=Heliobacterium chlorum TaxID=2698 RepID=A0ABR7T8M8_HELCL|nr:7-carboxy-7-deazaguanine synthase QueE [Heliobacterium chlorum]MBC9785976.1 7-carboxy-7-deazaguanine synthase QueE [Heliobacterium chlorum]
MQAAHLVELMTSAQGEGPWIGCRQIFLRFFGCNLDCSYCDTPGSGPRPSHCRVERAPGSGLFEYWENPLSVSLIEDFLVQQCSKPVHSVCLTGGEPLLHAEFIKELITRRRYLGIPFYLETNGTLPDKLAVLIDLIGYVSMDIKVPESEDSPRWALHRDFLRLAARKQGYAKIVITDTTSDRQLLRACEMVRREAPAYPIILQPLTNNDGTISLLPSRLLALQEKAMQVHNDVRLIPQTHKFLGIL